MFLLVTCDDERRYIADVGVGAVAPTWPILFDETIAMQQRGNDCRFVYFVCCFIRVF